VKEDEKHFGKKVKRLEIVEADPVEMYSSEALWEASTGAT